MSGISASTEAEVVEAGRAARDSRRTLEIVGGSTKRNFGRPVRCDHVLDVSGLTGIVSYEPEELLLTALPGTPVAEIEALLAASGQRLGFDPADWGPLLGVKANAGTIGGAISADISGPAAVRYGRARDQLLGFRAVNGFGEAYKGGGKVVKNVTGFDLPKLMCGAMGTLGALTEVTLRVFPKAARSATFVVRDVAPRDGLALLRRVWSSPLEATGLAYAPARAALVVSGAPCDATFIRLEGAAEPLEEKRRMLRALLAAHAIDEIGDGDRILDKLASGSPFIASDSDTLDVWRVAVPPASAAGLAEEIAAALWYADWAGGLVWIGLNRSDDTVHRIAERHGGHAMLVRASMETRFRVSVFAPERPAHAALTRAVKAAFDPLGLVNPGRMYEGV